MGKRFKMKLVGPILLVMLDCTLCWAGEVRFTVLGFALVFLANIFHAVKCTLQLEMMKPMTPPGKTTQYAAR